jgi:hypothetical protein
VALQLTQLQRELNFVERVCGTKGEILKVLGRSLEEVTLELTKLKFSKEEEEFEMEWARPPSAIGVKRDFSEEGEDGFGSSPSEEFMGGRFVNEGLDVVE